MGSVEKNGKCKGSAVHLWIKFIFVLSKRKQLICRGE